MTMLLNPGTKIGPYEVTSAIGAGGMGEVYRARDTRLKRDVALKVLPAAFAADADRLARFQREAELLATLNHPHIAAIYGLEQYEGGTALVLELVEGETLADRIARGPLPVDEALSMAAQIASALDAAHEQGVIHRDLKPANINVTPQGTIKVLDFGLAKLAEAGRAGGATGGPDVTTSPTITSPAMMTGVGALLGTAAYMAPEQARGRTADRRADVWAFGCVLYEMLTGRRAFPGADMADVLGAVIHKEPDYTGIPARVRPLLERCLEKDPQKRLRGVGDAMAIVELSSAPSAPAAQRAWIGWAAAAVCLLVGAALAFIYLREQPPPARQVRFQVPAPEGTTYTPYFILSPDGRNAAFGAVEANGTALWVYSLDSGVSRRLGTSGPGGLFWSPDGRFVGFATTGKLYKVDIAGGAPQVICDLVSGWAGGAWNDRDEIVFGQGNGPLLKVSAAGGMPVPVTELNSSRQEVGHGGPRFLPDGRRFVYGRASSVAANNGVFAGSLDVAPAEQRAAPILVTQNRPMYVPSSDPGSGYLLFLRDTTLMAQRFDHERFVLVGEAQPIAQQVGSTIAAGSVLAFFSVSANGVLAFRTGVRATSTPVLVERTGREQTTISTELLDTPENPRVSPDGRRLALVVGGNLWSYDMGGRPPIKLTFSGGVRSPLWTPDGQRLLYETLASVSVMRGSQKVDATAGSVLAVPADGSSSVPEAILTNGHFHPFAWSKDGRDLLLARLTSPQGTATDIVRLTMAEGAAPQSVVETPANEGGLGLAISPDGRWLAYASDVTGRPEVWVRAYPGPRAPIRISANGGVDPIWSKSGHELYYFEGNTVMAVAVDAPSDFNFKPAVALFSLAGRFFGSTQPSSYDVSRDNRFVLMRAPAAQSNVPMTIVLNWMELLADR